MFALMRELQWPAQMGASGSGCCVRGRARQAEWAAGTCRDCGAQGCGLGCLLRGSQLCVARVSALTFSCAVHSRVENNAAMTVAGDCVRDALWRWSPSPDRPSCAITCAIKRAFKPVQSLETTKAFRRRPLFSTACAGLSVGSPTWTRTRDLRINSQYKPDFLGRYGTSWDEIKPF